MTPALPLFDHPGDYILGRFVQPRRKDTELRVVCPADTNALVATHGCALEHVDLAVEAARAAQPAFRRLGEDARRTLLRGYQEKLRAHRDEIALTIAFEVGKPLWEARTEVDAMIGKVDLSLGEGARFTADQRIADLPGEIRHRPLGVDQRHRALDELVLDEELVAGMGDHVDQRVPDAHDVVERRRRRSVWSGHERAR